jgi:hypothetical protein
MAVKKRIGEMLLDAGVIDETKLLAALGYQRKWGGKLGQALIDLKLATEPQIVSALSKKFGYEVAQVSALKPSPVLDGALRLVRRELALRQTVLPVAADRTTLTVAMGDPSNISLIDELSFRTGRRVKVMIAGDREIAAAVRRLYDTDEEKPRDAIPLEDPAREAPLETTRDPFAAMPDHVREGYFGRPAHTLAAEPDAGDLALGEPILATDLLVDESEVDGPFEAAPIVATPPPPRSALLEALDRLARGEETPLLDPARVAAALARILLRRGALSEAELLAELARK